MSAPRPTGAATPPPRLVHLAEYTPPQGGSFIPMVCSTLAKARRRSWGAEAVFPVGARGREWIAPLEEAGIRVRYTEPGSVRERTRWIGELLDEERRPTLLHAHFSTYDLPTVIASRRRPWSAVFWHTHTVLSDDRVPALRNSVKNLLFARGTERILCPAQNIADAMARRRAPKDKLWVFPSPVEIEDFPTLDAADRARRRAELGLPAEATVLLLFGRDWSIKGGDTFMEAMRLIVDRGPDDYVALVHHGGEPADRDAARLGLSERIVQIGFRPDVQDLFGAADILVAPSRGEGMPFSVIESICSGTPVVASPLPGHKFLPAGFDACLVVEREPEAVAAATLAMLGKGRNQVERECARARAWIAENLGLDAATNTLLAAYEPVLERLRR